MKQKILILALMMLPMTAWGQGLTQWVLDRLDSMATKGIDRNYIDLPKYPWTIEARITESNSRMNMTSRWEDEEELDGTADFSITTHNGYHPALGLKISYRGTGIGFSKRLSSKGSSFSFNSTSGHYGFNLSLKSFENTNADFLASGYEEGVPTQLQDDLEVEHPIKVRSQFLDAYYMFNGSHYSYAAANKPGLIQRRSAGSVVAGIMYYHASVDFISNNISNVILNILMHNIGKQKMSQASIGVGYAYNWVPARGWLIGAVVMPMFTFYNRTKTYRYEVTYIGDKEIEDDDFFEESEDMFLVSDPMIERTPNKLEFNYDGRLSIIRNWERFHVRLTGQYHHFTYGNDDTHGWLSDWSAYLSLGYRF